MIRDQEALNILLVSEYAAERFCRNVRLFRICAGGAQFMKLVGVRNMIKGARG